MKTKMADKAKFQWLIKAQIPFLLRVRRRLHQDPGLRFSKEESAALQFILHEIYTFVHVGDADAFTLDHSESAGGMYFDLTFNPEFDWLLFRADIDAVPVQEKTGLEFSSRNAGVSHACGHDMHAAMLLTAMKIMVENPKIVKHNIRFVFQRAEENPIDGRSGGMLLVKDGVCKNMRAAYALHVWTHNQTPAGLFLSGPDAMLGNSDRLKVTISAPGGHVAFPNEGSSALEIGLAIAEEMKTIGMLMSPRSEYSLSPAIFQSGEGSNVRPQKAELWFALRNYLSPKTRLEFHQMVVDRLNRVAKRYSDATVAVEPICGHPALFNDRFLYSETREMLDEVGEKTQTCKKELGGEDFAHYLNAVTGCMWWLGAYQEGSGDHHTSTFNPDENVMPKGVLFWLMLASKEY